MAFIEGKCPKCHEILQIPEDREKIICMFCGAEIQTKDARKEFLEADEDTIVKVEGSWEDYYGQIREEFPQMLLGIEDPLKGFKRQLFEAQFRQYYRNHLYIIELLDKAYCAADDPTAFTEVLTGDFIDAVKTDFNALPKKKYNDRLFKCNMAMAIYVMPSFNEYHSAGAKAVAEALVEAWNTAFNQQLSIASFDQIQSGFRKRWCYITTAVCDSMGKSDQCPELMALRGYRDGYLLNLPEGEELIQRYYDMAPTIVNRINRQPEAKAIYEDIYKNYLVPCLDAIENNDYEGCKDRYETMMHDLDRRYLKTNGN